jgi:hypothetical protein
LPPSEFRGPSTVAPPGANVVSPADGVSAADRRVGVADPDGEFAERTLAVEDLVAGRLQSAHRRYVALASSNSHAPIYAVIARLLERRIAASAQVTASSLPSLSEGKR